MSEVRMKIPDESLEVVALRMSLAFAEGELRLAAAVKLYELGRLSSGAAAQLAGIPKPVFLGKLGDYGVSSFRLTRGELDRDAANA